MPRKKNTVPQYLLHPASGQARVRIQGRDVYLGKYGSPESKAKYTKLLAEHFGRPAAASAASVSGKPAALTISQLVLDYDDYARGNLHSQEGQNQRSACSPGAL